jgi:hypothetical protein
MNETIANLILFFGGCVLLSVFYWEVFHVVVLRGLRFRLFALRDETRRVAAERGLANSYLYKDLEKFICKTICFGPHISLISLIWFLERHHPEPNEEEQKRFEKEAPAEFKSIRDATAKSAITLMMINSPWVILALSIFIPIMWALGKLSKARIYGGTERFVDTLEEEAPGAAPLPC